MPKIYGQLFFSAILIVLPLITFSAEVIKTTKNFVVIDLLGAPASVGESYFLVNAENRKVALVEIKIIKNDKAFAKLLKGKSEGNEKIELLSKEKIEAYKKLAGFRADRTSKENQSSKNRETRFNLSALLSLNHNTQDIAYTNSQSSGTLKTAGNSFGLTLAADMPFNPWFSLRGIVGVDPFNTKAEDSLNCSVDAQTVESCKTNINYLTTGIYARFSLPLEQIILWSALGINLKMPLTKTSTVLNTSEIKPTSSYGIVFGVDYQYSPKYFIPASVELMSFQKTASVKTQSISLKCGFGWNY